MIEDQTDRTFYWLVPVGSAVDWELPDVDVIGAGRSLRVPPAEWTGGPAVRWLVPPPMAGNCLTDPERLHAALAGLTKGPRFTAPVKPLRRCGCGELVVGGEQHTCAEQPQESVG